MKNLTKRIDLMLVFIITLLTCSGCFGKSLGGTTPSGEVALVSAPSTTTIRFMNEGLYIGYLGAQRDFALIVDNAGYTINNHTQSCGIEQNGETVGCASTLAKLIMSYGIKTAAFTTEEAGAENILMYYATSTDFDKFGSIGENASWYTFLTGETFNNPEYSDFDDNDTIKSLSCGTNATHSYICGYSKEMSTKGYSTKAGNAMILLFHNGTLYDVITDKMLDPKGELNRGNTEFDELVIRNDATQKQLFSDYYNGITNKLKSKVHVSNATNSRATSTGSKQSINVLKTISELEDLISGRKGVDNYLLLITSKGFITEKVGTNYYTDINGNAKNTGDMVGNDPTSKSIALLINSISSFADNCAIESEPMLNFLKSILQMMLSGTIGALAGAAAGAGLGAIIGSVVPGIGTAIGAGVGAIAGAIAGFFAGVAVNKKLEEKLKSANGISDKSYCKIVESALTDIQINVPIYTYNIDAAKDNIAAYQNSKMEDLKLKNYYDENRNRCLTQYQQVGVPSGLISFITDKFDDEYSYADSCQKELVSNIVGGFGGAPSLQLYLQGKKADDLYGRVTSELVNEMLSVWGLKSIGDLYAITSNSTINNMSVTLGSAQRVNNLKYCISNDVIPSCEGLNTISINPSNDNYIAAFDALNGITLDFTSTYKNYSKNKVNAMLNESYIRNLDFASEFDNDNTKKYYYHRLNLEDSNWTSTEVVYGVDEDEAALNNILIKVKASLTNNRGNIYRIKYGGNYYLICQDNTVIGYNENGKIIYYSDLDEEVEYIFPIKASTGSELNADLYLNVNLFRNSETSIDSADEFYVYITYTTTVIENDTSVEKQAVFSYII